MKGYIKVVAALVFSGGKFLICQRPKDKSRALEWEFAGGKVKEGESEEQALKREILEELGVEINIIKKFGTVKHRYPDIKIELNLYACEIPLGEPEKREHAELKWIYPNETRYFNFCRADGKFLKAIRKEFGKTDGTAHISLGKSGEKLAAEYLAGLGYKILHTDYQTPYGEIDIIAQKGDVISFCEVKTRSNANYGQPNEAVNFSRKRRYIRAAENYSARNPDVTVRFDIIEVFGDGKINFLENAYGRGL